MAAIAVTVLVILAGMNVVKLNQIARDSAQSALWREITTQLKSRESRGSFPESLEALPLTDPDGGSAELLKLFEYQSDGASCTLTTVLRGKTKSAAFHQSLQ
ncbi:MAG TPA: hypothetical protein VM510_17595 [Caulifigura sp.]|nr:hypothetical protein [Caulifigura sp.]